MALLHSARCRGRVGGRLRKMDAKTIKMAMAAMADKSNSAAKVARKIGVTTTTLYEYVNADGSAKPSAQRIKYVI